MKPVNSEDNTWSEDKYNLLLQLLQDNDIIKIIRINNIEFKVIDNYILPQFCPKGFFSDQVLSNNWETNTFDIIYKYSNKEGIFLDIGAWIGPFTLYASNLFKNIYSFEPDKVAFKLLLQNTIINNYNNVNLIDKALSDKTGKSLFGGNGKLGNSESTLLVRDDYLNEYCSRGKNLGQRGTSDYRKQDIIEVDTITIEDVCDIYNINIFNIKLIKIDIEGGELILIPAMRSFLKYIKPILYISIHWCFLEENEIMIILDILFDIYNNGYFYNNKKMRKITQNEIYYEKLNDILFISDN